MQGKFVYVSYGIKGFKMGIVIVWRTKVCQISVHHEELLKEIV